MKKPVSTPATVRATLERISQEAKAKAQSGIAAKRIKDGPASDFIKKIKTGLNKPAVAAETTRVSRKVFDTMYGEMQAGVADLLKKTIRSRTAVGAVRTDKDELLVYPDGCRFMQVNPDGSGVAVVEQPPQIRTILTGRNRRHVPLPYVVFLVYFNRSKDGVYTYSGIHIGFKNTPIRSLDEQLQHPPLPNFSGHSVCMGSYNAPSSKTPNAIVEGAIGQFWQSVFAEYPPSYFTVNGKAIDTWPKWENVGPLEILDAKFASGNTLTQSLDWVLKSRGETESLQHAVSRTWNEVSGGMMEKTTNLVTAAAVSVLETLLADSESDLQPRKS